MPLLESFHHAVALLPDLAKFAIGMVLIISIPRLSRRVHLPGSPCWTAGCSTPCSLWCWLPPFWGWY